MSEASKRGRDFEMELARDMRRKGFTAQRDRKSGGGELYKADLATPGFNFSIEAKDQEKLRIQEWWDQAVSGTPGYKMPALAIRIHGDKLAVIRFNDFLDLMKMIEDDTQTIKELRSNHD